jgi:hypothetical protein
VPANETFIKVAVVPFDQITLPPQPLTLSFTLLPVHIVLSASSDTIVGLAGIGFTFIVCVVEAKLTQALTVQVALYVPTAETINVIPDAPVFHIIVPAQPLAVKVVELPEQILVLPEILGAVGIGFTTIVCNAEATLTQLFTVQVALYVPEPFTVIVLAVTPFDQMIVPAQSLAVRIIPVPWQTVLSASSETTVGADGIGFTVRVCTFEAKLVQLLCVQVALYVPDAAAVADEILSVLPDAPVLQVIVPVQPLAVKVVLLPVHIALAPVTVGGAIVVTVSLLLLVLIVQLPLAVLVNTILQR